METDFVKYVRRCHECQIHANLMHIPPHELHSMATPWPFSIWGIDIIQKISLLASNGHKFILVAIDYFTKWVEVASYAKLTTIQVAISSGKTSLKDTKFCKLWCQIIGFNSRAGFWIFLKNSRLRYITRRFIDHGPTEPSKQRIRLLKQS